MANLPEKLLAGRWAAAAVASLIGCIPPWNVAGVGACGRTCGRRKTLRSVEP